MRAIVRGMLVGVALIATAPQARAAASDRDTCLADSGDAAIAACTRAIESNRYGGRELAVLYIERAVAYANDKQDYAHAFADCDAAVRRDGSLALAYTCRGNMWTALGDLDGAIADFTAAIALDPKYAHPFNDRGNAWRHKGDLERAAADYSEAIRLDPRNATAWSSRCEARAAAGRELDKALADCDEALRLRPDDADALKRRNLV